MSTEKDARTNYTTVDIKDWGTEVPHRRHNFKAKPGMVNHGPVRSIETDFAALTEAQRLTMRIENFHYYAKECKAKMNDDEWWAIHRKEFRGQGQKEGDKKSNDGT